MSDVFGTRGRAWLERLRLPDDERETLEACLRTVDFLEAEVAQLDRALAPLVLGSPDMRRLLTLPGVSATAAATLAVVIGDIGRFPTPGRLVAYLGLDPRVSQSGNDRARHGRISKQGASEARDVLVEAAWGAPRARGRSIAVAPTAAERQLERELATGAEVAYERLVADWVPSRKQVREPQAGRASHDAERQPARQGSAPTLRFGPASLPHQLDYAPDPGPRQDGT